MASKYAQRFTVPDGFPEILKSFTREVLRNLPADVPDEEAEGWIYQFAVQYFKNGGISPMHDSGSRGMTRLSPQELQEKITTIFISADADQSGTLDHKEFKNVVKAFSKELGLPVSDLRRLMAEADENADGLIDYQEFVPLAVDIIDTIYAKHKFEAEKAEREAEAVARTRHFLLHGMPREQLDSVLQDMFQKADSNNSGYLSRSEFADALRQSNLGLTRKEINVLLSEVDEDADGRISYEEFLPLCFNLLVEIVSQDLENENIPKEEADLRAFFIKLFRDADPSDEGRLSVPDLADLVRRADLGLTTVQLHALMSEAEVGEDGLVDFVSFAASAAAIISAIIDVQTSEEKAAKVTEARQGELAQVNGMTEEDWVGMVDSKLGPLVDDEGLASEDEVAEALGSAGLDSKQIRALLSMAAAGDGRVAVDQIDMIGFSCLQAIAENSMVSEM